MDKLNFETSDMVSQNIEKIAELFPAAITEMRDENGKLKKGINFETLKQLLSPDVVDGEECYEFTWVGKKAAMAEAARPITKTLRPMKEDSRDWETTENLYIEGDNLEVLKILQESYLGKVKMIYIDPPYNTGKDFVYPDHFQMDDEEHKEKTNYFDEDGNINYSRVNKESEEKYHSDWCSMIYSRLALARNLLTDDGVIFISIDDNEVDNLKNISNEVFGENNLVAEIPWQSRASIQNDTDFSVNHEYICVYAKRRRQKNRRLKETNYQEWSRRDSFVCKPLPLDKSKFDNPDNDPRGLWKAEPFDAPNVRPNLTYIVKNPLTGEEHLPPRGRHWRISQEKFSSALASGRIIFGKDGKGRPQMKSFYEEKKKFGSIDNSWFSYEKVGTTTNGTKEVMELFDGHPYFDKPKPTSLLYKLIDLANTSENSIILDFFSGSATTAQAVMQLNAEDGGHRKFIMVQLPEPCGEKTEAYKAGYKNICEIGKERIRRAGDKIKQEHPDADLDIGFRVFRVDESNMKDVYYHPETVQQQDLFEQVSNIKEDRSDMDLLYACLLDWGVEIHLPHTQETVEGCTVHDVDGGALMACFNEKVPVAVVEYMAKKQPLRVVFRDSAFASDAEKINVTEIFKNLSPDTKVKVL